MINHEDVIAKMVEIQPLGGTDGFRKIKETLTRMGVPSTQKRILNQSAHILHRRGRYYICHFKELFALDGLVNDLSSDDVARRNRIVKMLEEWNLVKVLTPQNMEPMAHSSAVKVIKYAEREEWTLKHKYAIGVKKFQQNEDMGVAA